jgi:hypothetical protein
VAAQFPYKLENSWWAEKFSTDQRKIYTKELVNETSNPNKCPMEHFEKAKLCNKT